MADVSVAVMLIMASSPSDLMSVSVRGSSLPASGEMDGTAAWAAAPVILSVALSIAQSDLRTFFTLGLSLKKILDPHFSHWSPKELTFLTGSLHFAHLYTQITLGFTARKPGRALSWSWGCR